jgi:hypothetical protein
MLGHQSGGVTVFVDQTTKDFGTPDSSADVGTTDAEVSDGWPLFQRAMRAVHVVVPLVLGQHMHELPLAEDQHPIQALATDRADPPLGIGVGLRRTWRTAQHFDADIGEHGIEARRELRVAIADQEPETISALPTASMRLRAC